MQKLILETDTFISVNDYRKYGLDKYTQTVKTYKTKKARDFEKLFERYARQEMARQGWIMPPKEFFVKCDVTFIFPRTDMDCNNHYKCIFDVLTRAGVWVDDSRVKESVKKVMYSAKSPKMILEIYIDDQVGIFDTIDEFNEFKQGCERCKRLQRNCSILKECLESRLNENVYIATNGKWTCSKKG